MGLCFKCPFKKGLKLSLASDFGLTSKNLGAMDKHYVVLLQKKSPKTISGFIVQIWTQTIFEDWAIMRPFGFGGLRGAVIAHSPPASEMGGSNTEPYMGKMVVSFR